MAVLVEAQTVATCSEIIVTTIIQQSGSLRAAFQTLMDFVRLLTPSRRVEKIPHGWDNRSNIERKPVDSMKRRMFVYLRIQSKTLHCFKERVCRGPSCQILKLYSARNSVSAESVVASQKFGVCWICQYALPSGWHMCLCIHSIRGRYVYSIQNSGCIIYIDGSDWRLTDWTTGVSQLGKVAQTNSVMSQTHTASYCVLYRNILWHTVALFCNTLWHTVTLCCKHLSAVNCHWPQQSQQVFG